ncbi:MAG: type II toxin-antitoxin system prevent-host-death family antitoxin [Candidatus Solibacter usitatus]|nr:type II toxin-antitoxin system prevent-host-death family antitoxin [Candidatus Solibacter usitatus]
MYIHNDKNQNSGAKTHLSRYIDRVENGEVIIVCRHNQPVAELRPIEPMPAVPARVAGLLEGKIHWEPDAFAPMTVRKSPSLWVGQSFLTRSVLETAPRYCPPLCAPGFWAPQTRSASAPCQCGRSLASMHSEESHSRRTLRHWAG